MPAVLPPFLAPDVEDIDLNALAHERGLYWIRRAGLALESASVPFLALKGVPLSERYYRPYYLRACADIDLLIRAADFPRASLSLADLGYIPSPLVPLGTALRLGHHVRYLHSASPDLELHIRLQSFFGTSPDASLFFPAAVPQTLTNGYTVHVLGPVDEFVHLAAHAASHRWAKRRWLNDIVLLLEHHPALDWQAVAARIEQLRLWTAVLLTCSVLESEFGVCVPLTVQVPAAYRRARRLFQAMRMSPVPGTDWNKLRHLFAETATCDGPFEKARLVYRGLAYTALRRLRDAVGE